MSLQKSMLGGPEIRKRAISYLLGRRRYMFWESLGRLDPNEAQEESMLPDEWAAVRYGWGHSIADEQPRDPGAESDSWPSTDHGGADGKDGEEARGSSPPPVVTEETGTSSSTPASMPTTTGMSAGGKGKHGGKGRNPPDCNDPPLEDEAEIYIIQMKFAWKSQRRFADAKGRVIEHHPTETSLHVMSHNMIQT